METAKIKPDERFVIAGGNDADDYPVCNGHRQYWIYSLKDGKTVGYSPIEGRAALIEALSMICGLTFELDQKVKELETENNELRKELAQTGYGL